jgi:hypothetical protein
MTAGIEGNRSGLVRKSPALVDGNPTTWPLLENVRDMLPLQGGRTMAAITGELGVANVWSMKSRSAVA